VHELRAPLSAVLGWTHFLRSKKYDAATADQALAVIESSARAQARLIEDLLDLAHINSGKLRLDLRPVEMAAIVEAAVHIMCPAAEAKGVWLQTVLDLRGETVLGDAGRLQQVLLNLLSNAIKFTPGRGRVMIRLERQGSQVALIVSDTGQGINPDYLPFLFEQFRQANDTSNLAEGGLGLGLAIVRHLVTLHGGKVQAQSDGEGQGAVFTVTLPLAARAAGKMVMTQEKKLTRKRTSAASCAYH
jgi:signal transduction histidine kinase